MVEYKKIECLCGEMIHTSVGGTWIDKQWLCGKCLTKMATKAMRLEKRLEREIKRLDVELVNVKRERQTVLRQNVVSRLEGERSGLKLALMACILEMEDRTADPKTKKGL